MELAVSGDTVTVESLAPPPLYLQTIELEVGFRPRGLKINETFSADEMAADFIRAFNGIVFSINEIISFEFHGEKLEGVVKSISTLELADEQRKGVPVSDLWRNSSAGILMDKTDITLMKAGDSAIKINYSAKK